MRNYLRIILIYINKKFCKNRKSLQKSAKKHSKSFAKNRKSLQKNASKVLQKFCREDELTKTSKSIEKTIKQDLKVIYHLYNQHLNTNILLKKHCKSLQKTLQKSAKNTAKILQKSAKKYLKTFAKKTLINYCFLSLPKK